MLSERSREDIQPEIELLQAESPGSSPKSTMSPEDIMRAVDKTLLDVETNILRERLKILTVQKSKLESKIWLPQRPSRPTLSVTTLTFRHPVSFLFY